MSLALVAGSPSNVKPWVVQGGAVIRAAYPLHAFFLIVEADTPARVAPVMVEEFDAARHAAFRFRLPEDLYFHRAAAEADSVQFELWADEAHRLALHHRFAEMRDWYARCRVHLSARAEQLSRVEWARWLREEIGE